MSDKAVVILSGGLDSTTCMAVAADEGFEIYALTFDYGQRHRREVDCARRVAEHFGAREHRIVQLDFLQHIGGSSLTDSRMEIPSGETGEEIPNTYVPGRNLIFLSLAASFAEVIGARAIFIGVSAVDYSGYPDCRPQFIEAVNRVLRVGTRAGDRSEPIEIRTPLIHLSKAETIKLGHRLGAPYHLTTSCYRGGERACGECDSCRLRLKGFREAGIIDPIPYEKRPGDPS